MDYLYEVREEEEAIVATGFTITQTQDKVNLRWHYMDGTGGGWSGTYSVIPS